jgi:hypothetical protein
VQVVHEWGVDRVWGEMCTSNLLLSEPIFVVDVGIVFIIAVLVRVAPSYGSTP